VFVFLSCGPSCCDLLLIDVASVQFRAFVVLRVLTEENAKKIVSCLVLCCVMKKMNTLLMFVLDDENT
jgi:hypothetical protein